jgi:hypothetical protein
MLLLLHRTLATPSSAAPGTVRVRAMQTRNPAVMRRGGGVFTSASHNIYVKLTLHAQNIRLLPLAPRKRLAERQDMLEKRYNVRVTRILAAAAASVTVSATQRRGQH